MSVELLTTADADDWNDVLPASSSTFGSVEYARVQERVGDGQACLLVAGSHDARIAYPMLLRDVPFELENGQKLRDSTTPPYTGPIAPDGDGDGSELDAEIAEALAEHGVVAEFAHLHPWRGRPAAIGGGEADREVVWVDLSQGEDEIWSSYTQARRNQVRQAQRAGVTVREGTSPEDVAEFHRIYIQTMERTQALEAYHFPLSYFEAFAELMPANARFALAEHEGRVVAVGLYPHDDEDVYYYLGGADHDYQHLRPANALIHETILWAREQGKRRMVMGGGYRPDDGIFRFKASFSPLRATLELTRRVHRPDDYEALVEAWRARHPDREDGGFFPAYRAD